jgi:hypothetical protein
MSWLWCKIVLGWLFLGGRVPRITTRQERRSYVWIFGEPTSHVFQIEVPTNGNVLSLTQAIRNDPISSPPRGDQIDEFPVLMVASQANLLWDQTQVNQAQTWGLPPNAPPISELRMYYEDFHLYPQEGSRHRQRGRRAGHDVLIEYKQFPATTERKDLGRFSDNILGLARLLNILSRTPSFGILPCTGFFEVDVYV